MGIKELEGFEGTMCKCLDLRKVKTFSTATPKQVLDYMQQGKQTTIAEQLSKLNDKPNVTKSMIANWEGKEI